MEIAFVGPTLAEALGWTLLHSLWQGLVIFLLLLIGLHLARRYSPILRYRMAVIALLGLLVWVIYTFHSYYIQLSPGLTSHPREFVLAPFVAPLPNSLYEASFWEQLYQVFQQFIQQYAHELAGVWLLGVALFVVRWAGSLYYTYQLRRTMTVPAMESWQQKVQHISSKLGIQRKVGLMESARVEVPMVVGHLKPLILFPLGMISGLSPIQVESIIAHELAHVKRYDFLVNLLLSFVEILFFYHPVYWWISARISDERELCCDDLAVGVTGNPRAYAEALMEMESLLQTPSLGLAIQGRKNHLLGRIKRICLGEQEVQKSETGKIGLTLSLLFVIAFFTWFRLPAQEEVVWEEGDFGEIWEELALEETDGFGEDFFPELAEVPEPELPPEIEEFPSIEGFSPFDYLTAEVDSPFLIPPFPDLPPPPTLSALPPMPPIPDLPENLYRANPEEYTELMEEYQQHYQEWESQYQEVFQEWQASYSQRYQEWQVHIQERYREYEQRVQEFSERNAEFAHSDQKLEMAKKLEGQLRLQERELQRSQIQLERSMQLELMQQQRQMAQEQLRLQRELQQLNNRIRLKVDRSLYRRNWAPDAEPAPAPKVQAPQKGSSNCAGKFRDALRKDGFQQEAEKKKLEIELYDNQGKRGIRINGKPYAPKLAERWIKVLEDCGYDLEKVRSIGFSQSRRGPNQEWASYEDADMEAAFRAFSKEMTQELYEDGLIGSRSKRWNLSLMKGKLIINGKKIPKELLPKYEEILKSHEQYSRPLELNVRPYLGPDSRLNALPHPGPTPLAVPAPVEIMAENLRDHLVVRNKLKSELFMALKREGLIDELDSEVMLEIRGKVITEVNGKAIEKNTGKRLWNLLSDNAQQFEGDFSIRYSL